MPNMSDKKVKIPEQEPQERIHNFLEVAIGYSDDQAVEEAQRCLQCKTKPCVEGCPVNVMIPEFIDLIAKKEFDFAYSKIKETNCLPAICGRVCPQESQCEKYCVRGKKGEPVAIGRLERFAADRYMKNNTNDEPLRIDKINKKVAVIGSGPAGLTCAGELTKYGYEVTIFEAFHVPGGVLMYGIPEFRLPKKLVQKEIQTLVKQGVEIKTNMVIGKILLLDEIIEMGYDAIFIGTGAGLPKFMEIPGENLKGLFFE
jgi:glutamate synthase (NADPH) small chain